MFECFDLKITKETLKKVYVDILLIYFLLSTMNSL